MFLSTFELQYTRIVIRISPRFVYTESIILRGPSSPSFYSEKHSPDECVDCRLSWFVFPVNQVDPLIQIYLPVMEFSKVF